MVKKEKTEGVGHIQENPNDPVFVTDLSQIESLAKKMTQESLSADQLDYNEIRETICGTTDDSQPVEQYDGTLGVSRNFADTHQGAVGVLRWHTNLASVYDNPGNLAGLRWCTGTMISDNLFLTAGHCFDQTGGNAQRPRVNGTSNIISPQEIATRMNVEFNFQVNGAGILQSPVSVGIEELIEYRLDGLDFAIVRLAGNPGAQHGITRIAEDDADVGNMICIIGHPQGQPKRIEAGPITSFDDFRVRYNDIDTMGGNSGSGLLRASDGCIVGIHTNGGCNAAMTGSNFGLRISRLRAASPTVRSLSGHSGTLADRLAPVITNFAADNLRTNVIDDFKFSTVLLDRPRITNVFLDRKDTHVILDQRGTSFIDDQRGTSFLRDRGGSDPIGDRKATGLDKQFSDRLAPQLGDRFNSVARPRFGEVGGRPFVMATPHHASGAMGGLAQTGQGQDDLEMQIEEIVAYFDELNAMAQAIAEEMAEIEASLNEFYFDE